MRRAVLRSLNKFSIHFTQRKPAHHLELNKGAAKVLTIAELPPVSPRFTRLGLVCAPCALSKYADLPG